MEVVDLISHFSYTFIKGLLNKNCPHTNTLKLWFYNFAKTSINFFAKLTLTISQELSRIDEDFLCAIARIWQWRHPAVLAVCRLYPTYKGTKNLGCDDTCVHRHLINRPSTPLKTLAQQLLLYGGCQWVQIIALNLNFPLKFIRIISSCWIKNEKESTKIRRARSIYSWSRVRKLLTLLVHVFGMMVSKNTTCCLK